MMHCYTWLRRGRAGRIGWLPLLLCLVGWAPRVAAQTVLMPANGTTTYTTCSGTLHDSGGPSGPYTAYADGTITLLPGTAGSKIKLEFTTYSVESYYDRLSIYDGSSTSAPLIGSYDYYSPGTVYATNSAGTLTLRFTSSSSGQYDGFTAGISCVTTVPQPDLAVQGASVQPLVAVAGNPLQLTSSIYNLSSVAAYSSSVGYYLSTDAALDANDVLLGNTTGGQLGGGQSSYRSGSVTLPTTLATGTYYVLFVADYQNQVSETNETNNVAAVSLNVVPSSVDLLIQQQYLSASSVAQGGVLGMSCNILNQGNTLSNSSSVGYYLSTNTTLDTNDQLLTSSFGGQLYSNYPAYRSATTNLPASTAPGSYYILFVADYQNVVTESSETNNVVSAALTVVAPSIDLTVTQAQLSQTSGAAGAFISYSSYVYNQGNTTAGASTQGVYLSTDAQWSTNDELLTSSQVTTLNGSSGYSTYGSFTVPTATAAGSYYILFVADNQNQVTESSETNNVRAVAYSVITPTIDLTVTQALLGRYSAGAGTSISYESYVYNQGNTTAGASTQGVYFSTDAVLSSNDALLTSSQVTALGSGSGYTTYGNFTVPATATAGSYYILFVADNQNQVTEGNETNNVRAVAFSVVTPTVDLVMTQAYSNPGSTAPGNQFAASSYVYNQGNSLAASSNVGYYLSADAVLSSNDVLLGTSTGGSLNGGDYSSRYATLTVPTGTAVGQYYVLFVADYQNQVTETNETNNVTSTALQVVAAGIDLTTSQAYLSMSSGRAGSGVNFYNYINNLGTSAASVSNVGYYLSTDASLSSNDVLIGTSTGGYLGASSASSRSSYGTIPSTTAPGAYYVLFVADYLNQETETNETNNVSSVTFTVTAPFSGIVVPYSGTTIISACSGTVYDNGGTGFYADGSNGTLVINPGTAGAKVQLAFSYLTLESCCDRLTVYDGPNTSSPVLGTYTYNPGTLVASASNTSGALTLSFFSDTSVMNEGFEAVISCVGGTTTNSVDLVIQQAALQSTNVLAGSRVSASCLVANRGTATATGSITGYYLSTDAVLSSNDLLLGAVAAPSLIGGSYVTSSALLQLPASLAVGTYYVLFVADHTGSVVENTENNNVQAVALNVSVVQSTRQDQLGGFSLEVYPNPVESPAPLQVRLSGAPTGQTAEATLLNSLGQEVARKSLPLHGAMAPVTFDTHTLSRGAYLLRISGAGLHATRSIVIK